MRKGCDGGNGEKKRGKNGEKKEKRLMEIVATSSFASSRPPERRPLERRMLVPNLIGTFEKHWNQHKNLLSSSRLLVYDNIIRDKYGNDYSTNKPISYWALGA